MRLPPGTRVAIWAHLDLYELFNLGVEPHKLPPATGYGTILRNNLPAPFVYEVQVTGHEKPFIYTEEEVRRAGT